MLIAAIGEDPIVLAERAHGLVQSDTPRAAALAELALARARADANPEAEVASLHALGFAREALGDPRAVATLRMAVRAAERHGLSERAAMARRPLAVYLALAGRTREAVRELEAAGAVLAGVELARLEVARIAVFQQAGRPPDLPASERAVRALRSAGDTVWEARLLGNRGLMLAERGEFDAAEPDLLRARDLFAQAGMTVAAHVEQYQLVRVSLARGDLPRCLALLDSVDATALPVRRRSELELLRAKTLVAARLRREARDALERAQTIWREAGFDDPEGRVDAVTMTLLNGDAVGAVALGRQAQRSFAAQRRVSYAAQLAGRTLEAAIAAGEIRRSSLASGRRAVAVLEAERLFDEALRVRVLVARAAIELGSRAAAVRELEGCGALRRRGAVADRVQFRHVEALVRLAKGDAAGAQRALSIGLRLLDAHRAQLGAIELRASVSELGVELAQLGLRIALERGAVDAMLVWAERLRASALLLTPVTPNPALHVQHAELRRIGEEIRRARRGGDLTPEQVARRSDIEQSIRRASRHEPGGPAAPAAPLRPSELAGALGGAALVELVELDRRLTAIVLVDGRLTRHELGPAAAAAEHREWLAFALARLGQGSGDRDQREAARRAVEASAQALGELLFAPLTTVIEDRPVVVVPPATLHAVPWSILPRLRGRPITVAASALSWLARQPVSRSAGSPPVLVAGPRLRNARREVIALGELYPGATVLAGRSATVPAVLDALDGAGLAHIACHGHLRVDSPLFSALQLAGGELNAYALQGLRRAPELVVLAACDLAVPEARPGDELLGFAAALIAIGTRSVIASVVPVPDAAAWRLMTALHLRLAGGERPAVALAGALAAMRPREYALAGFICIGAG